jgi:DNA-binding cell septation regulator SpoVG
MAKRRVVFFAFAALLIFSFPAYSELVLTGVEKDGNSCTIIFNDSIRISGISLSNGKISMPEYAKNGKIYKNFSILQRDFLKNLYEAVKLSKTSRDSSKINYKINKFKIISSHKTIKAFSSVIFEEKLEVECRVMKGKYGLWVAWPSKKDGNIWKKDFIIINKDLKNNIESELIRHYTNMYE